MHLSEIVVFYIVYVLFFFNQIQKNYVIFKGYFALISLIMVLYCYIKYKTCFGMVRHSAVTENFQI